MRNLIHYRQAALAAAAAVVVGRQATTNKSPCDSPSCTLGVDISNCNQRSDWSYHSAVHTQIRPIWQGAWTSRWFGTSYADAHSTGTSASSDRRIHSLHRPDELPLATVLLPLSVIFSGSAVDDTYWSDVSKNADTLLRGLSPWEVTSVLWALAFFGVHLEGAVSDAIIENARVHKADLTAYDVSVLLWFLTITDAITPELWTELLTWVGRRPAAEQDEAVVAHLFHAAYLAASNPSVAAAAKARNSWSLLRSNASTTQAANGASTQLSSTPHTTREELEAIFQGAQVSHTLWQRVEGSYRALAPLHPSQEAPLLAVLHVAKMLPHLQAAAREGSAPYSRHLAPLRGLMDAAAVRAEKLLRSWHDTSSLMRDLSYHWRADTVVAPRQAVVNDVCHVLARGMGMAVQQQSDGWAALPARRLVLVFTGGPAPAAKGTQAWSDGMSALAGLLRDGLTPTGFGSRTYPGFESARRLMWAERGWNVREVNLDDYAKLHSLDAKKSFLTSILDAPL